MASEIQAHSCSPRSLPSLTDSIAGLITFVRESVRVYQSRQQIISAVAHAVASACENNTSEGGVCEQVASGHMHAATLIADGALASMRRDPFQVLPPDVNAYLLQSFFSVWEVAQFRGVCVAWRELCNAALARSKRARLDHLHLGSSLIRPVCPMSVSSFYTYRVMAQKERQSAAIR